MKGRGLTQVRQHRASNPPSAVSHVRGPDFTGTGGPAYVWGTTWRADTHALSVHQQEHRLGKRVYLGSSVSIQHTPCGRTLRQAHTETRQTDPQVYLDPRSRCWEGIRGAWVPSETCISSRDWILGFWVTHFVLRF